MCRCCGCEKRLCVSYQRLPCHCVLESSLKAHYAASVCELLVLHHLQEVTTPKAAAALWLSATRETSTHLSNLTADSIPLAVTSLRCGGGVLGGGVRAELCDFPCLPRCSGNSIVINNTRMNSRPSRLPGSCSHDTSHAHGAVSLSSSHLLYVPK